MTTFADRIIGGIARGFVDARRPSASLGLLGEARMRALAGVRARVRDEALSLAARADAGDRDASIAHGALAERALLEMRREVEREARGLGPLERMAASAHARFSDTDEMEHLDDPNLDREVRVRLLDHLDALNIVIGNYGAFFRAIEPLLSPGRPTRVLDLAAGHGGFALEATRIARARGIPIEITATDLRAEYLALGEAAAAREGLDVRFRVQDALDLSNLEPGEVDVVLCTQSLHHFDPSMVTRMFREATRAAERGVVFIDGCRSIANGALISSLCVARYGDPQFAHDALVSFRRFFAPEELALLTTLGPEADAVEARWMRPGHCLVRWTRPTATPNAA